MGDFIDIQIPELKTTEDVISTCNVITKVLTSLGYTPSVRGKVNYSDFNSLEGFKLKRRSYPDEAFTLSICGMINSQFEGRIVVIIQKTIMSDKISVICDNNGNEEAISKFIEMVEATINKPTVLENQPVIKQQKLTMESIQKTNRKVFIVHGHDNEMKIAVAECLRKLEFEPIILNEQANQSMTVIEKIERHSDVEFAVILLSPCDEGRKKDVGDYKPRARQNVILELGYFIGKIGRKNTCSLLKESVEAPSDFTGIVYTDFDSKGAWQIAFAKELRAAGFEVDTNKLG